MGVGRALRAVYKFVVGDPILLGGGLGSLLIAALLHRALGPLTGVLLFLLVTATLYWSIKSRPG